jgi:hypothetical protein
VRLRGNRQLAAKARDFGGAIRSERVDETPFAILVSRKEALLATLKLDHGRRGRVTYKLESKAELVRPEEGGLHGMRRQAKDPPGNSCRLRRGTRPVAEPTSDVAAGKERCVGDRDRQQIGGGLNTDADERDIAAEPAPIRKLHRAHGAFLACAEADGAGTHSEVHTVGAVPISE